MAANILMNEVKELDQKERERGRETASERGRLKACGVKVGNAPVECNLDVRRWSSAPTPFNLATVYCVKSDVDASLDWN